MLVVRWAELRACGRQNGPCNMKSLSLVRIDKKFIEIHPVECRVEHLREILRDYCALGNGLGLG